MTTAVDATSTNSTLNAYLQQQAANATSSTSSTTSSTSSAADSSSAIGLNGNLNTFLKILTTQLQNQDPTAATDTNQFTQELVQFAGAEQQIDTNTKLDTITSLLKSGNSATAALGYIGKYVEAPTTSTMPLQSGKAELGYTLPDNVSNVAITVMDSTGKTVNTLSGTTTTGSNYISWDGKDSNGNQLADGTYSFVLAASSSTGTAMTVSNVKTIGVVTSISTNTDGTTSLSLGGMPVTSTDVDAVYDSSSLPTATAA